MNVEKLVKYGSIGIAITGTVMFCVGFRAKRNARKVVGKAIDTLAERTQVDISDAIIKAAAEKAADKAASEAVGLVRKDINLRVYNSISSVYTNVEKTVRDKMAKSIERDIDMDDLKKSVENKASSAIVDKFINDLSTYADPIMSHIMNAASKKEKT